MSRGQDSLPIMVDLPRAAAAVRILTGCARRLALEQITVTDCGPLLVRCVVRVTQKIRNYRALLECLVKVDEWALRQWPFPPLYESGVRYELEPQGQEVWQSTPALYLRGVGDCEDLAAHLTAELRLQGDNAVPNMEQTGQSPFGGRLWHIDVKRQNGQIEDPSSVLGME